MGRRAFQAVRFRRWSALLAVAVIGLGAALLVWMLPDREHQSAADTRSWEYPVPHLADDLAPDHRARMESVRDLVCEVMDAHPRSASAVAALAVLHYLAYDAENEARCWERCLELDPGSSRASARLVALAEQRGDHEQIVRLMERAMARPSADGYVANRQTLASALRDLRRYDEARAVLEEVAQQAGGSAEFHLLLGDVYSRLDELEKAREALEIAVALAPQRGDALYRLSIVCSRLGEDERAAAYRARFEALRTGELASESAMGARHEMEDDAFVATRLAEVLKHAAVACLEGDDAALAERSLLMAVAVHPADAEAHQWLAEFYLRTGGDLAEARRHAEKAVELQPTARAFLVAAAVAEQSGDLAGARTALERAMTLDPGNRDYRVLYDALSTPR